MSRSPALLVVSHDVIGAKMAGPGIRYYHLARVLARALGPQMPITLAAPSTSTLDLGDTPFAVTTFREGHWDDLAPLAVQAMVILAPADLVGVFPQLGELPAALVVDGYDPLLAEWLAMHVAMPLGEQTIHWQTRLIHHAAQLRLGDFYICASERQRDWWLGQLEASGRINPATYAADPSLRSLVDVVPYGLPETPPQATRPTIKGVWPGIAPPDKLVLWGGGLWPWLDPETAVRAVAQVANQRPDVRLIFPGTRHPNPNLAGIHTHTEAVRALAAELGLLDRVVFFGDWVPYADWANVLLESDVALSLHFDTVETRLAFRTRVLDYLWAGLPVVTTMGDATSDLVTAYDVGRVVGYRAVEEVAAALLHLLDEPRTARAAQFDRARQAFIWERAAAPLAAFCQAPQRAPDRAGWRSPLTVEQAERAAQIADLQQRLDRAEAEAAHWHGLVQGYEQGRFIRTMQWLHSLRRRLRP